MRIKDAKKLYTCPHCCSRTFKKKGYFYRRISKTYIPRYLCLACRKGFSTRTLSKTHRQKRPDLNQNIFSFLTSGVTLRRTARNLNCNYLTVYRKFLWLSEQARLRHLQEMFTPKEIQFDEMESIEHTKLKPLTIALAVSEDYKILGVKVGTLPAKGHLSQISLKKYGFRENQSDAILKDLLQSLKVNVKSKEFVIKSDAKPSYAKIVNEVFPLQPYQMFIAQKNKEKRRELKYTSLEKRIYDPLFALNQRFAKLRDHIKRLTRRSWCTTKKIENLEKHLLLYIASNNAYPFI